MAKEALSEQQWADLHALWISTDRSNCDLAREFSISEAALRKHAQKFLWGPRNAPARKRAIVAAAMAGANGGARLEPRTEAEASIQSEADQDVADMRLAASVGRRILQRCEWLFGLVKLDKDQKPTAEPALDDPKELKAVAEATRSALETIRRARNLDEPAPPPPPEESKLEKLASALGRARAAR